MFAYVLFACLFGCVFVVRLMSLIVCVCLPVLCHRLLECLFAVFAYRTCAVALVCHVRRLCVCLFLCLFGCFVRLLVRLLVWFFVWMPVCVFDSLLVCWFACVTVFF